MHVQILDCEWAAAWCFTSEIGSSGTTAADAAADAAAAVCPSVHSTTVLFTTLTALVTGSHLAIATYIHQRLELDR
jgi:hypothetical protein